MTEQRLTEILRSNQPHDVFYNEKPVWIQSIHRNTVTVGFMDGTKSKDVLMEDLYEHDWIMQKWMLTKFKFC